MLFSQAFGLTKSQPELDFVDVDLTRDTRLFVDPYALSIRRDDWSYRCTQLIVSFFQTAIDAIRSGNDDLAQLVLSNLHEPNETKLGMSKTRPSGRGVSGKQAFDLFKALRNSNAAKTGILSEMAECDLFIEGISYDKVSDITTNVIRSLLVEYTQAQCKLHRVELSENIPAGMFWNPDLSNWTSEYALLPTWNGSRVLLVPKSSVRHRMSLDSQEYYNHFVLNFLQAENLKAGSSLVHTFKNGRSTVFKKVLKELFPFGKDYLFQFTKEFPKVLDAYKNSERRERNDRSAQLNGEFDETAFAEALIATLGNIPAGRNHASEYHSFMIGVIEFMFFPSLIYPFKEKEIDDGRKRIDITYTNAATSGFFHRAHTAHQVACNLVMVECKNYVGDVANPELDQLAGRFSINRGKLGILLARSCEKPDVFFARCRDAALAGRGFVVPLFDTDVISFLEDIRSNNRSSIDAKLDAKFTQLL